MVRRLGNAKLNFNFVRKPKGDGALPSPGRPAISRAGDRLTLRERLAVWFGLSGGPTAGEPLDKRRVYLTAGLGVYLVLLIALALAYNVPILAEMRTVRSQVESGAAKVASLQRVASQLDTERERRAELLAERDRRYRELPDAADLPVVVERLQRLAEWTGGSVSGVEYSEPRWTGDVGQLQTHAALEGSFRNVAAYVAAMDALLPASSLERLAIRLESGPGRVLTDLLISVGALKGRPDDAPRWDSHWAWERAGTAASGVTVAGSPFTPGASLWQHAREAGVQLPELRLAGIARSDDEIFALIVYDGQGRLVRSGSRMDEFYVVSVDYEGVDLEVDDRRLRLSLTATP